MRRPNVLLLVVDSLRADALFDDRIPTPNLTKLVQGGTAFVQAVSTSTTTTPCFASLLTGCYPPSHGVRGLKGYRLNPGVTTIAEAFGRSGYYTHAEPTGPLMPQTGVLRGFEQVHHRRGTVPFFSWREAFLERLQASVNPWFALLHVWEIHWPYRSPPDFGKRWDRRGYEDALAATDEALGPILQAAGEDTLLVVTGDHGELYPESALGVFAAKVANRLKRTMKPAKWFPYLDRRLSSLAMGHGFGLDEPLIRVPLVFAGPGIAHATVQQQVRHVDLLPTLAELCALEFDQTKVDGRSLGPLLDGRLLPEEPAYMEAVGVSLEGSHTIGARTPGWKLLKTAGTKPALYRLGDGAADEKHNLHSELPDVVAELDDYIEQVNTTQAESSGMSASEEAILADHLQDLGYIE